MDWLPQLLVHGLYIVFRMKNFTLTILFISFFAQGGNAQTALKTWQVNDSLSVKQITEHVFVHESQLRLENGSKVGCNGIVYVLNEKVILGDTPSDSATTAALIQFIEDSLNATIRTVMVSHFHVDALGGLAACHAHGINSYSHIKTPKLAKKEGYIAPVTPVVSARLQLGNTEESMILFYGGPGHTKDNVVMYIPAEKLLFGGCMIKCINAGYGNLADADMKRWAGSVEIVKQNFPEAEFVIPGHGNSGGKELLDYTIELISGYEKK